MKDGKSKNEGWLDCVCVNHPRFPAVARCAACGKAICEACIIRHAGVVYCSATCRNNSVCTEMFLKEQEEKDRRRQRIRFVTGVLKFLLLVGVMVAAWYGWQYYQRNQSDIGQKIQKGVQTIETASGVKKAPVTERN